MNKINPNFHQRKSIRLPEYDYSQAGLYFITICTQNRECIFGDVINGEMVLNDAGMMVEKWYYELENKFSDIRCHEMIVMPNHFHCIVENVGDTVGADLRVCPNINDENVNPIMGEHTGSPLRRVCPKNNDDHINNNERAKPIMDEHTGSPLRRVCPKNNDDHINNDERAKPIMDEHTGSPLHRVVQWFKTMTTNEYIRGVKTLGWQPFDGKLWQRNYYEHIIRNEKSFQNISEYIINNPSKWNEDKFC